MSCSLIERTLPLPGSLPRRQVDAALAIPSGLPKRLMPEYRSCIRFGRLLVQIAQETANAILNARYKEFDALVKNFGCQITALEVKSLVRDADLIEEAARIELLAQEILKQSQAYINQPPLGDQGEGYLDYLRKVGLDFQLSEKMLRLVRLHLLAIVNTNIEKEGREVPRTEVSLLSKKDSKLKIPFNVLIDGIQQEESVQAANYIRLESKQITSERGPLIQKVLEEQQRVSKKCQIASVPLMYNTEAVLSRIEGYVLVKNKLRLCGKAIPDTLPLRTFVKLPEGRTLSTREVEELPKEEALIVIEGYMKNDLNLEEKITSLGLIAIVNANCAVLKQYASDTDNSPIEDEKALSDLDLFKADTAAREVMEIDHIYCASKREEEEAP